MMRYVEGRYGDFTVEIGEGSFYAGTCEYKRTGGKGGNDGGNGLCQRRNRGIKVDNGRCRRLRWRHL